MRKLDLVLPVVHLVVLLVVLLLVLLLVLVVLRDHLLLQYLDLVCDLEYGLVCDLAFLCLYLQLFCVEVFYMEVTLPLHWQ